MEDSNRIYQRRVAYLICSKPHHLEAVVKDRGETPFIESFVFHLIRVVDKNKLISIFFHIGLLMST